MRALASIVGVAVALATLPAQAQQKVKELADELDVPLLGKVPLTMPLREHADGGVPLVLEDPDEPAAQAIRQVARGLIAIAAPALPKLPTLPIVQMPGAHTDPPVPAGERKPAGMSLPMA